jgi:CRISPR-associated protein Csh1
MLEAMYEIGKIQQIENPLSEMTQEFGNNYKYLFKILFRINHEPLSCYYETISVEEIDKAKKDRYLYKKGAGANAPDVTPVSKITEPKKTFKTKILKAVGLFIKNIKDFAGKEDLHFLESLDAELKDKQEQILTDFLEEYAKFNVSAKNAAVLGIAFIHEGMEKYPGDLEVFVKNLLKIGYKSNYFKFGTTSKADNKTCYMCKKTADEVWGYASTFQFYTVDKIGMVTGGFNQQKAWKNYPLCPDCYLILERGKKYILEKLYFRFCGFNYLLIPKLVLSNPNNLERVLTKLRGYKTFTLEKKDSLSNVEKEEDIFDHLMDNHDYANFDFLFFEEKQSGKVFNILLYLENITPTRLAAIVNAKRDVDDDEKRKYKIFTNIPYTNKDGERDYYDIFFTFHRIRNFFMNSDIEGNFDKYFLDIIKNIFFLKPISQQYLLNRFLEKTRSDFSNDKSVFSDIIGAFKILIFLDKLNILNRRRYNYMERDSLYEGFFSEYKSFFDDDAKKAVFLEGVLVQKLLNIQQQERNAQPFRSRLNGLKIDEKIARRLLTETINKLEEYEKNYYKKLETEISHYFLTGDLKKFSSEELSFYFVMGMNLANQFEKKENKE